MAFVAGSILIGSAIAGGTALYGAHQAANASEKGTAASIGEQSREYDQTRADYAPYREAGAGALSKLADIYGIDRPTAGTPANGLPGPLGQKLPTDLSKIPMPVNDPYWGNKTQADWDAYLKGTMANGAYTITGRKGINAHLRNYINDNAYKYGTNPTPAAGAPGAAPAGPVDRTGGFTTSPGYQFRLDQGNRAIAASAAARGRVFSGGAVKAADQFSQGTASEEWNNWLAGLKQLAGFGTDATQGTAVAGINSSNHISDAYMQNAANQGSAYLAGSAGVNNAVQGGLGNYSLYKYLKGP